VTPPDPGQDDALALRSRHGDPRALAILYRRHAPALLEYLERMLGDRAAAEDALHDSFLRLFHGRGTYRPRGRFREWLFTVATRIARDRLRTARRRERIAADSMEELLPPRPASPAERTDARRLAERVDSALRDLPASYAAAFHLRVRADMTYAEIARITGEPEGTLRSRVHHALKRVRHALAVAGPDATPLPRSDER
jgi:RNA polymerase sigma-70 factor (ECF subfamily)